MNQNSLRYGSRMLGNNISYPITAHSEVDQNFAAQILLTNTDLPQTIMDDSDDSHLFEIAEGLLKYKKAIFNLNEQ